MRETKNKGIFIFGNRPEDTIPVIWELYYGNELSNKNSWRAGITIDVRNDPVLWEIGVDIMLALKRKFNFKLQIENGSIFPCGIYSIEGLLDGYGPPGLLGLVICSRDQPMEYLE